MEGMAVGLSVPIYQRQRTASSNTKRPQLLKAPKKKASRKRLRIRRHSDTSQSDGSTAISPGGPSQAVPQQEQWEHNVTAELQQQQQHEPVSETASTIDLPLPPPPPPDSPGRSSPRFPPGRSLSKKGRPKLLTKAVGSDSELSDSPFTDLVNSINNTSRTNGAALQGASQDTIPRSHTASQTTSIEKVVAAEPQHLHGFVPYLNPAHQPAIVSPPERQEEASSAPRKSPFTLMMPPAPNQNYVPPPAGAASAFSPQASYQYIQEMCAKRINTLDYLRKTHEGRVYWYNTLLYSRPDLLKLPSFAPHRLARRATNFLLLGLSLPAILDLNTATPLDYLRALNILLAEFEAYQTIHPTDGSGSTSLSRARIPRFFKTGVTSSGVGKGRRSSSAAEIGAPLSIDQSSVLSSGSSATSAMTNASGANLGTGAFASSEQELLPGEEYSHLLTPSLPFDPDFFEVFATLCDVLIETYGKISALINGPTSIAPGVTEMYHKADARLRKVIVSGVIKELEEATRAGIKSEMKGVNRVVLGGLV